MGIDCKEVARRLASDELTRANWRERVMVGFHMFMCDKCRRYKSQLETMGQAARGLWPKSDDRETARRLENDILSKINK